MPKKASEDYTRKGDKKHSGAGADTASAETTPRPDVLVLGEPLVEVSTTEPFRDGAAVRGRIASHG